MSTDNKEDMCAEEEAAEDSRLIATATCTDEKSSSGCSREVTVVTRRNLHDLRLWYQPDLRLRYQPYVIWFKADNRIWVTCTSASPDECWGG